jgi:formylglycine-generating enzyme required for sulfatase activity
MAFCAWLSRKTGRRVTLPTEAQWEYACRAGTATAFSFGDRSSDFSAHANLGDVTLRAFAANTSAGYYSRAETIRDPNIYDDWIPKDARFDDSALVTTAVGGYRANAWGLHDMHGNAAEWTRSAARPYPYVAPNDRDAANRTAANREETKRVVAQRIVRGGSWRDRPVRCRSAFRLSYPSWQAVFNVGFRIVIEGATTKGQNQEMK